MILNYNNHELSVCYEFSEYHYYCNKCKMHLYDPINGGDDMTPWVLSFTIYKGVSSGKMHNDLKNLTCEEIIIKRLLE